MKLQVLIAKNAHFLFQSTLLYHSYVTTYTLNSYGMVHMYKKCKFLVLVYLTVPFIWNNLCNFLVPVYPKFLQYHSYDIWLQMNQLKILFYLILPYVIETKNVVFFSLFNLALDMIIHIKQTMQFSCFNPDETINAIIVRRKMTALVVVLIRKHLDPFQRMLLSSPGVNSGGYSVTFL